MHDCMDMEKAYYLMDRKAQCMLARVFIHNTEQFQCRSRFGAGSRFWLIRADILVKIARSSLRIAKLATHGFYLVFEMMHSGHCKAFNGRNAKRRD